MAFNKAKFDRVAFDASFLEAVGAIKGAEEITRREVRALSRSVLSALHCTENVGYLNTFLEALTPVNRKAMVIYFQAFTGFHFDSKSELFTKKDKVTYADKEAAAEKFLDDPMNNFWSYAQRAIKVEAKEFTLDAVTKATETFLKKAKNNNFKEVDVLRAMLKGGITAESIIAIMDDLGFDVAMEEAPERSAQRVQPAVIDVLAREVRSMH
jgi:hypothetical protein